METTSVWSQCSSMVSVTNLSSSSCPSPAHRPLTPAGLLFVVVVIKVMYALNPPVPRLRPLRQRLSTFLPDSSSWPVLHREAFVCRLKFWCMSFWVARSSQITDIEKISFIVIGLETRSWWPWTIFLNQHKNVIKNEPRSTCFCLQIFGVKAKAMATH